MRSKFYLNIDTLKCVAKDSKHTSGGWREYDLILLHLLSFMCTQISNNQ